MYNTEKHRYECDRCGKRISNTQTVQLCKKCNEYLENYIQEKRHISGGDTDADSD